VYNSVTLPYLWTAIHMIVLAWAVCHMAITSCDRMFEVIFTVYRDCL